MHLSYMLPFVVLYASTATACHLYWSCRCASKKTGHTDAIATQLACTEIKGTFWDSEELNCKAWTYDDRICCTEFASQCDSRTGLAGAYTHACD
ncbi:hypothetical protein Tdes44962_MAKER06851 [Teratosphaeria destructans]|uniref:Uncharacterized protein n=1 Tax=Teratosphaeria destructans TaxID=418781 RepID=A0A9W7W6Q0_9PEZI|nr:hypothetical protein Tdes44962_MAKER06851 [Teratosphaeria destructans]